MEDLSTRINEAEVYKSMGLLEEAMGVYQKLLADPAALAPEEQESIKEKLEELRKELDTQEDGDQEGVSQEEITAIKESLSAQENVQTILDGAFAFKELGLYEEAVGEYTRLFRMDYPAEKLIPEIAKCLMKLHPPQKASEEAVNIIESQKLEDKKEAILKFRLGVEMEKVGHPELAIPIYKSALALNPKENRIKNRLLVLERREKKEEEEQQEASPPAPEPMERRKEERFIPRIPEFVFVELEMDKGRYKGQTVRLQVLNYSKHGLAFLVKDNQKGLLNHIRPGEKLHNVAFYARWAIIRVDVLVKHITKLEEGPYKGHHVIGVESKEIIESSRALS